MKIDSLNYKNDPLFYEEEVFINDTLNIYKILMDKEYMLSNNKGQILKKCPYVYDEKDEIKKIIKSIDEESFIKLRKLLSNYLCNKTIRKDTFDNWLNKKTYPLPLIRIISILINKELVKIIKDKKITDFCNRAKIKLPLNREIVISDFLAYLIGLHLGDGTLNKERWKIVDGDREQINLKYTYEFLNKIANKVKKIFLIKNIFIYPVKGKGAYELIIPNKWFCKYLKFVYGLDYNTKQNPKIPYTLKNKKEIVLRGLMDSDGSIKNYRTSVSTKYPRLCSEIKSILKKHKIEYKEKLNNIQRKNIVYIIEIKKESIVKFIQIIGFSHPRKLNEVIKYLNTTSSLSIFLGYLNYKPKISEKEFIEVCNFLRPIKNAGKVRFISEFNKLKENEKNRIINNLKLNFEVNKEPNKKGYIYSYKIEKILTNHCIYKKNRDPMNKKEINNLVVNLNSIWKQ